MSPKVCSPNPTRPQKAEPEPTPTSADPKFYLKKHETLKTRGGRPRNVDPQTRPEPEKQTLNLTRPRLLLPDYITIAKAY